jgi:hypothetical protein
LRKNLRESEAWRTFAAAVAFAIIGPTFQFGWRFWKTGALQFNGWDAFELVLVVSLVMFAGVRAWRENR